MSRATSLRLFRHFRLRFPYIWADSATTATPATSKVTPPGWQPSLALEPGNTWQIDAARLILQLRVIATQEGRT